MLSKRMVPYGADVIANHREEHVLLNTANRNVNSLSEGRSGHYS